MSKAKTAITPTREENYPEWYQQVIRAADLAENSVVRGCMVIKPWGYALWENIQAYIDARLKETGHENAYFPIFIPKSFIEREADHVEGFAKECAVVTHHRLSKTEDGKLEPTDPLEEPLIVRPTSEAIIGESFARWIKSYRDLPLLINQWANVVRWEMRTRLFLRTSEFLWQEGHTAHVSAEESKAEALMILDMYVDFAENILAMPVLKGEKSENERFPGALNTYTIEAMMQDKKALQAGTAHDLGQNFAKAFDIKYLSEQGEHVYVHMSSWAVTTRLIGALIMTHGDDDGLIIPPKIAPLHVVILPLIHDDAKEAAILDYCNALKKDIEAVTFNGSAIKVKVDTKKGRGGNKAWSWVKKGVPVRLEVGAKELEANAVFMGRRDQAYHERKAMPKADFINSISDTLEAMQENIFQKALRFREENTKIIDTKEDFYAYFKASNKAGNGFALAHFCGDNALEKKLQEELKVTIRCIPIFDQDKASGKCIFTGKESPQRVVFAKAY